MKANEVERVMMMMMMMMMMMTVMMLFVLIMTMLWNFRLGSTSALCCFV
jgi:hypothetical protein